MVIIVDHAYEPEKTLQRNLVTALRARRRGFSVKIIHPVGFIHGRLKNIQGVIYEESAKLPRRKNAVIHPAFIVAHYAEVHFVHTGMPSCNASMFLHKGRMILLARETNYTFRDHLERKRVDGWPVIHGWPEKQHCYTNEVLYDFDLKTNTATKIGYLSFVPEEERHRLNYIGYEDMRIMAWGENPFASFTVVDNDHNFTMGYAEVKEDLTLGEVKKVPTGNAIEKNWLPIAGKPHQYIYSFEPYQIIDMSTGEIRNAGKGAGMKLRGSSPVIMHRGRRICMAHINNWPACKSYLHLFVEFGEDMSIQHISCPFSFFGAAIEFNTCIFSAGDDLEVLFSIHDQLLYRVTISADLLDRIFAGTLTNASPISDLYERLYADAVSNGNIKTAVGVATFSVKKDIRKEAAVLAKGLADVDDANKECIISQLNKQP